MPILFADDTNLFINGDDLSQMAQTLNAELDNISNWLKGNKLSLNVKKKSLYMYDPYIKAHSQTGPCHQD